jgi:hypothetical protein
MATDQAQRTRELERRHLVARLRSLAFVNKNSGDDFNTEPPMVSWDELNEIADALTDAADMLESSR